jgi:Xaa-Pro aminopeptidase
MTKEEAKTAKGSVSGKKRHSKSNRLAKLRTRIEEKQLDALLVSQQENVRYLSGFTGSSAWLLISSRNAILATDFRYVEQAKTESADFEIMRIKGELRDWICDLASDLGWRKLGFEANVISYDSYHKIKDRIKAKQANLKLIPNTGMIEQLRSVKERQELESIAKAVELVDVVFEQARGIIRPGITEKELAWEMEKLLRQGGSEGVAFDIIIASGPNSALPHAQPGQKVIRSGEALVIDMGARINGYCSDFTRTLFPGKADEKCRKIYDIVLKAQCAAIDGIESGMAAAQADRLARTVIEEAGYGDDFGHGLGHGVGLAIHELPVVNPSSSDSLVDGMVFTIEPGIYLSGWGGVRIEDTVVLENGRVKVLTQTSKNI